MIALKPRVSWVVFSLLLFSLSLLIEAQQAAAPDLIREFRERFQSRDWRERREALSDLQRVDRRLIPDKSALVFDLLLRENQFIFDRSLDNTGVEEAYSDPYYTSLLATAIAFYREDKSEPRYAALAGSSYNFSSPFAAELSIDAPRYLDLLAKKSSSDPNRYVRINTASILGRALAENRFPVQDRDRVRQLIVERLDDADSEVRNRAITIVGGMGGEFARQALLRAREAAKRSPSTRTPDELRKLEQAIEAVEGRGL